MSHNEIGVAFLWGGSKARWPGLLERFPALAERLQGAVSCSRPQGAGPLHQRVRSVCSPRHRLALMGDAAGY